MATQNVKKRLVNRLWESSDEEDVFQPTKKIAPLNTTNIPTVMTAKPGPARTIETKDPSVNPEPIGRQFRNFDCNQALAVLMDTSDKHLNHRAYSHGYKGEHVYVFDLSGENKMYFMEDGIDFRHSKTQSGPNRNPMIRYWKGEATTGTKVLTKFVYFPLNGSWYRPQAWNLFAKTRNQMC